VAVTGEGCFLSNTFASEEIDEKKEGLLAVTRVPKIVLAPANVGSRS
jgi:hypothetical protein